MIFELYFNVSKTAIEIAAIALAAAVVVACVNDLKTDDKKDDIIIKPMGLPE